MRLFEHPDFEQAVIRAAEHFRSKGLREAIIEKDYFVTEALRVIEVVAGDKAIDGELKKLRQAIEKHPGLTFVEKESQTIGGFGRNDRFEYAQKLSGAGDIRNRVFVEAGTTSGREPSERVPRALFRSFPNLGRNAGTLGG